MNYLISIESFKLINEEVKKIVNNNSYITFNMNRSSIGELIEEASYFNLTNDLKYILVTNADFFGSGKIKEEDNKILTTYLNKPNHNTIIIFTTLKGIDQRKKLGKLIKEQGKVININKLDKKGINEILTKYLRKYQYDIDYQTINYIMDNCFNNLDIMFNELNKIMLYYCFPCRIKLNDVKNIVGREKNSNNFHFVDSVIAKDLKKSLILLKDLMTHKVEVTSLVILLAREYRLMYYVKHLYKKLNMSELSAHLGLMDWQITKLYTNSNKFSDKELINNLRNLADIDLNIKNGTWDKDVALYGFLMDACS